MAARVEMSEIQSAALPAGWVDGTGPQVPFEAHEGPLEVSHAVVTAYHQQAGGPRIGEQVVLAEGDRSGHGRVDLDPAIRVWLEPSAADGLRDRVDSTRFEAAFLPPSWFVTGMMVLLIGACIGFIFSKRPQRYHLVILGCLVGFHALDQMMVRA
jgi:hypothetical protein